MMEWAAAIVLALVLGVGCRGSGAPTPEPDPAAGPSAAIAGGSAVVAPRPGAAGAAPAPAPVADAGPQPLALVDEMRALPLRSGDRTKAMALHKQALKVHAAHQYAESERAWAEAARADPSWTWPFYNLACTTAVQGRPLDALAYLDLMRQRGPDPQMLWRVEHDAELRSIRSRPEYEALVIEIEDGIRGGENAPPRSGSGRAGHASQEPRPK